MVDTWHWAVQAAEKEVVLVDPSQYKYKHTLQREQRVCVVVLTSLVGEALGRRKGGQTQGGGGGGGGDAEGGAGDGGEPAVTITWTEARTVMGCILQVFASSCTEMRQMRVCVCVCVRERERERERERHAVTLRRLLWAGIKSLALGRN